MQDTCLKYVSFIPNTLLACVRKADISKPRNIQYSFIKKKYLGAIFILGTIHKGRLLKGVGRWVHQKEIY